MNGSEHTDQTFPDDGSDPVDDLLRTRVQAAAAEAPSAGTAQAELVELTPRFRRARQRRQAATAALASAAAVVVVVAGAFALGGTDPQRLDTAGEDGTSTTSTTSSTSTSTTASTTTTAPTTVPSVTTPTSTVPSTTAPPATAPPSIVPPSTVSPTIVAPTTVPVGGTQVAVALGGTATIRWSATQVSVLDTSPAPGWSLERVEQKSATRVEVRFRRDEGGSGSSTSTIDARVVDGRLDVDV